MYKLTYFNVKDRAETIRFIFALKEIPYEDIRINPEIWPEIKKSFTWGQLPALDILGKGRILKSKAIILYLAQEYGLTGANDFEAALCEEFGEAWKDLRAEIKKLRKEKEASKQFELKQRLLKVHIPFYLNNFETIKNENAGDFLVGRQLTWIDLLIATGIELIQQTVDQNFIEAYPALLLLKDRVYNIPLIKNWISTRPITDN